MNTTDELTNDSTYDPTNDPKAAYRLSLDSAFYTPENLQDVSLPSLVYLQSELAELSLVLDMPSIQAPPSSEDLDDLGYEHDTLLVHRDGRIVGAQQPPDYYAYSPTRLDTWEDGAQAIEKFDGTVPGENFECSRTTQAVTVESSIATVIEHNAQIGNADCHQIDGTGQAVQESLAHVEEHQPLTSKDLVDETRSLQRAASPPWIPSLPTARTIEPNPATAIMPIDIEDVAMSAEVEDNSVPMGGIEKLLDHLESDTSLSPVTSDEQIDVLKAADFPSRAVTVTPDAASSEPSHPQATTESSLVHQGDQFVNDSQPWDTQLQQAAASDAVDGLNEDGASDAQETSIQGVLATGRPGADTSGAERSVEKAVHDTIELVSNESVNDDNEEDEVYETASDSTPTPALIPPNKPEVVNSEHSDIETPEVLDNVSPSAELTSAELTTPPLIEAHATLEEQPATEKDHTVEQVVTDTRKRARSTEANASSDTERKAPSKKKSKASGTKDLTAAKLKHVGDEVKHLSTKYPVAQPRRLTATTSPRELTKKPSKESLKQDINESDVIEVKQKKPTRKTPTKNATLKQTDTDPEDEIQPDNDSSTVGPDSEVKAVEASTNNEDYDMQERLTDAHSTPTPSQSGIATPNCPPRNHVSNRELAALGSSLAPGMHLSLHQQPAGRAHQSRDGTPVRGNGPSINYNEDNIVLLDDGDEDEPEVKHLRKKRPATSSKRVSGAKKAKIEAPKTRAARRSKAAVDEDGNDEEDELNLFPEYPAKPKRFSTAGAADTTPKLPQTHQNTTTAKPTKAPQDVTADPPKPKTPVVKNKFGFSPVKPRTTTRASAKKMAEENIGKRLRSKD